MKDSAVLLIDCPDRKGLVARVSGLLYERGANILHADQHIDHDLGLFFMRVEWGLADGARRWTMRERFHFDLEAFRRFFTPIGGRARHDWKLTSSQPPPSRGALLLAISALHGDLLHRWRTGELVCEIPLTFRIIARSRSSPHSTACRSSTCRSRRDTSRGRGAQLAFLARHEIELVVLARYMQILSPQFVAHYPAAIINVHHSFLPAFTGARPYHAAHARGVKLIGATSHYVTEVLDDGPIIEQDVARISHRDQVEDLVARGRDLERMVLSRAVRWHLDRRILCYGNKTVVFD